MNIVRGEVSRDLVKGHFLKYPLALPPPPGAPTPTASKSSGRFSGASSSLLSAAATGTLASFLPGFAAVFAFDGGSSSLLSAAVVGINLPHTPVGAGFAVLGPQSSVHIRPLVLKWRMNYITNSLTTSMA